MAKRVIAVVFDGFLLLDMAGPLGVFEVANAYLEDGYAIELVSLKGGAVRSSAGIEVETLKFMPEPPVDLIIVPGGDGTLEAAADRTFVGLVSDISSQSLRCASVCSGSFILAAAGILNGKRATTHWGAAATLQHDYPQVAVDADCIFIEDGNVWTSAGITAGIDLALALVEKDHGFALAQQTAQGLVVYHRRSGGQHQFSAALELQGPDSRFGPLLEWTRERLHERLDVERLAQQCGLSPRHFSRAFMRATGMPPAKAVEKLRVDKARPAVVAGEESLELIARRIGFGTAAQMRRSFIRHIGQPPQSLRRQPGIQR
jgi:transcriptional regulator GlxA family with amidase domain